jgi:lipopolysaccharide/colanic/teichoic acid biosynthesis glycosyltransferase
LLAAHWRLMLCSPLFLAIAVAIKLSSKGPVLFRQQRVGQYGKCFTFLKFRSMYVNNDHFIHQKFVTELIANEGKASSQGKGWMEIVTSFRATSELLAWESFAQNQSR